MEDLKVLTADLTGVARATLPQSILELPGRVLYTPAATLISDSHIYFLGANPGVAPGGTEAHALLTVEEDLKRLERKCNSGSCLLR
jgi:hypothetical protein